MIVRPALVGFGDVEVADRQSSTDSSTDDGDTVDVAEATGGYYAGGHPAEVSDLAKNTKLARRLWAVSAQALVNRGLATLNEMIAFG